MNTQSMRFVELGNTGLRTSVLGFGCAALLGRAGRKESLIALQTAYDSGITFYDTARSYGYGESEALLGEFFQSKRHQVLISTKFGIVAAKPKPWMNLAKPLARQLVAMVPNSRKLFQKTVKAQFTEGLFSVPLLRSSLEESLKQLKTDYVDVLFAHLAPSSLLQNEELMRELENIVKSGKARTLGISSDPSVVETIMAATGHLFRVFQFPYNLFDANADRSLTPSIGNPGLVINHPFGGVYRAAQSYSLLQQIAADPSTPDRLQAKIKHIDERVMADVVLNSVLKGSGAHVIVPAMMKPHHIHFNVQAISQSAFDDNELQWMRRRCWRLAA